MYFGFQIILLFHKSAPANVRAIGKVLQKHLELTMPNSKSYKNYESKNI